MSTLLKTILAAVTALALLPGCGGGGGGSSSSGGNSPPPPPASRSWQSPAPLENTNGIDARQHQVAIDANGNAIAVWEQHDSSGASLWASRYTTATGWSVSERIDAATGQPGLPDIAMRSDGRATVVWHVNEGETNIKASRYVNGQGWSVPELVEQSAEGTWAPRISITSTGTELVTWTRIDGTTATIWLNEFVPGVGWGTERPLDQQITSGAQIDTDSHGKAIATWARGNINGALVEVYASNYDGAIGWDIPQRIDVDGEGNVGRPEVGLNTQGGAMIVWSQATSDIPSVNRIWSRDYSPSSGWSSPSLIRRTNDWGAGTAKVIVDESGNAIAVWIQREEPTTTGFTAVWGNRYVKGSGWETEQQISVQNNGNVSDLRLAEGANGTAIATWSQQASDGESGIYVVQFKPANGWGPETVFEKEGRVAAWEPQVSTNSSGDAVIVWRQNASNPAPGAQPASLWTARYE